MKLLALLSVPALAFGAAALTRAEAPMTLTTAWPDPLPSTPGAEVLIAVRATNHGERAVTITGQEDTTSHSFRISNLPLRVEPGESAVLEVRGVTATRLGIHANPIRLRLDPSAESTVRAPVIVHSKFEPQVAEVDFGVVEAGSSPSQVIVFSSEEVPTFALQEPLEHSALTEVKVQEDKRSVRLTLRDDLPWGPHRSQLLLSTGSTLQPHIPIETTVEVRGDVVPSTYSVEMGLQRQSSAMPFVVRLEDLRGAPLELGAIKAEGAPLNVEQSACPSPSESCRMLSLTLAAGEQTGVVGGVLKVGLPDHGQELSISYGGLLVSDSTRIQEIDSSDQNSAVSDLPSVLQQISSSGRVIEFPAPEGTGPLLRWRVSNDKSVFGYLIYRSEREEGPFERINPELVIAYSGEESSPVEYKWRDTSARTGQSYWYRVDVLERSGIRKTLASPVRMDN